MRPKLPARSRSTDGRGRRGGKAGHPVEARILGRCQEQAAAPRGGGGAGVEGGRRGLNAIQERRTGARAARVRAPQQNAPRARLNAPEPLRSRLPVEVQPAAIPEENTGEERAGLSEGVAPAAVNRRILPAYDRNRRRPGCRRPSCRHRARRRAESNARRARPAGRLSRITAGPRESRPLRGSGPPARLALPRHQGRRSSRTRAAWTRSRARRPGSRPRRPPGPRRPTARPRAWRADAIPRHPDTAPALGNQQAAVRQPRQRRWPVEAGDNRLDYARAAHPAIHWQSRSPGHQALCR